MAGTNDARGHTVLRNCMRLKDVADILDACQEQLEQLPTNRVATSVARKLDTVAQSTRKTATDTAKQIGWQYVMKRREAEQYAEQKSGREVLAELKHFNKGLSRPSSGPTTYMGVDGPVTGKRKEPLAPHDTPEFTYVRSLRPRADETSIDAALRQLPPPDNGEGYTARTAVHTVWSITTRSAGSSMYSDVSQRSIIQCMIDRKLIPVTVKRMEERMRNFKRVLDNGLAGGMSSESAVKKALELVRGFDQSGKPFTADRTSLLQWAEDATRDDRALTTEDIKAHLMQCKQTSAMMRGQVSASY